MLCRKHVTLKWTEEMTLKGIGLWCLTQQTLSHNVVSSTPRLSGI